MAESASIMKVSHKHEAIINYMLGNPTLKLSEVAAAFKVTQPWLSTIIHSHAFQDQLQRRHDELFDSAVLQDVGAKLHAAADMTIDAYMEKVPNLTADQLISAQDKLFGRLGYGTQKSNGNGASVVNIQINQVDKEILKEARDRIGTNKVGTDNNPPALSSPDAHKGTEIEGVLVRGESAQEVVR